MAHSAQQPTSGSPGEYYRSSSFPTAAEGDALNKFNRQYYDYRVTSPHIHPIIAHSHPPPTSAPPSFPPSLLLTHSLLAPPPPSLTSPSPRPLSPCLRHGYQLSPAEQLRLNQCQRSRVVRSLTESLVFSIICHSVVSGVTSSRLARTAAFAAPSALVLWMGWTFAKAKCASDFSLWGNSPLGHDMREAAGRKWGDRLWMQRRLQSFAENDAQTKGTGLPLLYDFPPADTGDAPQPIPALGGVHHRQMVEGRDGGGAREGFVEDRQQPLFDLPPSDAMEGEMSEGLTGAAAALKRPLFAVNVNDRTLLSVPPGRPSTATPSSPSSPSTSASPSPLSSTPSSLPGPSSSPPPPALTTPPLHSGSTLASSPARPNRRRTGEDEDDGFGLGSDEGGGVRNRRGKAPARADEEERRTRREDRRRVEQERREQRGTGERKRAVRRNEFGDEVYDG